MKQKALNVLITTNKILVIAMVLLLSSNLLMAQNSKKVNLNLTNTNLKKVIWEIKKQTNAVFVYHVDDISEVKLKKVYFTNSDITDVIKYCLKDSKLKYSIESGVYVISKKVVNKKRVSIIGQVKDSKGIPLPGVTVLLKGKFSGTSTDNNGKYFIRFEKDDNKKEILEYRFVGMTTKSVEYKGQKIINVILEESAEMLEEAVVNTGYEVIDKRKLTSAVTSLKAEDILVPGINTIDKMLEGHVPGMIFMQNSGQLGATARLRIRGTSTILGSQEPLWVVDGIIQEDPVDVDPQNLNDLDFVNLLGNAISGINPEDIATIDVLKDAAATAIYGTRASNGVIVITTKKGKVGPPRISYSFSGTFTQRPHYSDKAVNMMNSKERVDFSRDLIKNKIVYSPIQTWLGYEKSIKDYYNGVTDFDTFQKDVSEAESRNTDWFGLLMRNSFSNKHTVSVSGGSSNTRYYASLGVNNQLSALVGESARSYTSTININTSYKGLNIKFGLNASVKDDEHKPSDIEQTEYAYRTSRAIPAYNSDGSYWYYGRDASSVYSDNSNNVDFNIMEDMQNSYYNIKGNNIRFTANVGYSFNDMFKLSVTGAYGSAYTSPETYHGADTYYGRALYNDDYREDDWVENTLLPNGGELVKNETRKNNYTLRASLNFSKYLDEEKNHQITSMLGTELSSIKSYGFKQTLRCYHPERGKTFSPPETLSSTSTSKHYEAYLDWLITDDATGVITDRLTNKASAYLNASYSYKDLYIFSANVRVDGSNKFGDSSNDKILPIYAFSGRWNIKDNVLKKVKWVDDLNLRASFGYQGNMLDSQSPRLTIKQGKYNSEYSMGTSSITRYPNPDLKWEKTSSWNASLTFSIFKGTLGGTISGYYRKTTNAFMNLKVSEINGITKYVVNRGTLENQGIELSLSIKPVNYSGSNPDGFRWSIDPQLGSVINKLIDKVTESKTNTIYDPNEEDYYKHYLDGGIQVSGKPLNTFYSYKFTGLNPDDGRPTFYASEYDKDLMIKYSSEEMTRDDVILDVMESSGTRVPWLQGGLGNTFSYKGFTLRLNMSYSFGSKVRLLNLYDNISDGSGSIAPQPNENVRSEFSNRWKRLGDENYTNIPAIISSTEFDKTMSSSGKWWAQSHREDDVYYKSLTSQKKKFADNIWEMYDNSNVRVVSGDYVKLQSLNLTYRFKEGICKKLMVKSLYLGFSATNLFTICSSKLKGQDPSSQSGSSDSINLSIRPTYSFSLNVSF